MQQHFPENQPILLFTILNWINGDYAEKPGKRSPLI